MLRKAIIVLAAVAPGLAAAPASQAQVRPVAPVQAPATPAPPAARPATAEPQANVDSSYLLGPGDVVDIGLVGRGDFSGRARVSTDGTILLPLIGKIKAADRTVLELSDDIRAALIKGQFYSDPVVRAEVLQISSRYAVVLGNVGQPGLLPLDRTYRLSEILARVGGKTGGGADYVLLTRGTTGATERYSIDELASGGPEKDPLVQAGDKLYVPSAETQVFYVSGQVNTPGAFTVTDGLTFRMAIAKGGGVTENGSEKKLKVVRAGKPIKVKLEDPVKVGDIITVGERLF